MLFLLFPSLKHYDVFTCVAAGWGLDSSATKVGHCKKKKKVWEPMSNFRTFLSLCENKNSSLDLSYSHFALLHMVAVLPHVGVITV